MSKRTKRIHDIVQLSGVMSKEREESEEDMDDASHELNVGQETCTDNNTVIDLEPLGDSNTMTNKVSSVGEHKDLEVLEVDQKVDPQNGNINQKMFDMLVSINTQMGVMNGRLGSLEKGNNQLKEDNQKLNEIFEAKFGSLEVKMDSLESKLNTFDHKLENTKKELKADWETQLNAKFGELDVDFSNTLERQYNNLMGKLYDLEKKYEVVSKSYDGLSNKMVKCESSCFNVSTQIIELSKQIVEFESDARKGIDKYLVDQTKRLDEDLSEWIEIKGNEIIDKVKTTIGSQPNENINEHLSRNDELIKLFTSEIQKIKDKIVDELPKWQKETNHKLAELERKSSQNLLTEDERSENRSKNN
ncbi:uncharacterized protein LOC126355639 [Schistocerca gregaria]|uniref:uncharacterized protein LOC126355639 n=1 Tax=Schistocerca gregaria TaxID=7010 RepID=UPI00211E90D9|nr:uncharacterized protein LOC126355639 [Schistocerca gregaria]